MYRRTYGAAYDGDARWRALAVPGGERFDWNDASSYVRRPTFFENMTRAAPESVAPIEGARALALLGESITTDHISPAGSIRREVAGRALPGRARRRAARLQLVRIAPRQP